MCWWVLEPFGAVGPELGEALKRDGCKVLHVVARQHFATTGQGWSASSSLLLDGGLGTETLQGPPTLLYRSDGAEPIQDCSKALKPPTFWITMPQSWLWGPAANTNTKTLPQMCRQHWEKPLLLGLRLQELPAPRGAGANPAAARGGLEPVSPGVLCLRCHPARFDLGPWRRAVCLETRSRAWELGQASVGISGAAVGPGTSLGLLGAAAGQKVLGWRGDQPGGDLTQLPPSSWCGCPERERIPILISGMQRGLEALKGFSFPLAKLLTPAQ